MGKGKLSVVMGMIVLSLFLGFTSGADRSWRKSILSPETTSSFSTMVGRVGPSSIVIPVDGNVYPVGYYNVTLNIGQPPRPYFLDIDTGSDLTWLQCDAPCVHCTEAPHPLYKPTTDLVVCKDPLCAALHPPGDYKCESPQQCDYEVDYADGGSSFGVLLRDTFSLNSANGAQISPRLALGCGYDQLPSPSNHPLDGIVGLGRGKSSILSQLNSQGLVRNVVGHCLSGRGGGFIFFGDSLYDPSRVVWTSMSREYTNHYSPGHAELFFGGKTTGSENLVVIFDSGSSYTYFNSEAYNTLTSMLKRELNGKPLKEAPEDRTLPLCWKGRKPFKSLTDVKKYFKLRVALSFESGKTKTQFELPPESYLIISSKRNVCLGILNGIEAGLQNLNLIGDISMLDTLVIYDNEKQMIGWVPANCDKIPKSKTTTYILPKWSHLKELHKAIKLCEHALLNGEKTNHSLGPSQEVDVYADASGSCTAFLSNTDDKDDKIVEFRNVSYHLPAWSVSILPDCKNVVFNTAKITSQTPVVKMVPEELRQPKWEVFVENAGTWGEADLIKNSLDDHINITKDTSNYLWCTTSILVDEEFLKKGDKPVLLIESKGHALHVFVNNDLQGSASGNGTVFPYNFTSPIPLKAGNNEIQLLSMTVGLPTAGPYYEFVGAGLTSVKIKGLGNKTLDLSESSWNYKIGVQGEHLGIYKAEGMNSVKWTSTSEPPKLQPLTWYKVVVDPPAGDEPIGLDMLHMGKGMAWLNGEEIGRYWPRKSSIHDKCVVECNYRGKFMPDKCFTGCGEPTQRWYHVPRSWFKASENVLVIFEEKGGDPTKISFARRTVSS